MTGNMAGDSSVTLKIGKTTMVVEKATLWHAFNRERILTAQKQLLAELANAGSKSKKATLPDSIEITLRVVIYPALAGCTKNALSYEKFATLSDLDADLWYRTVEQLNPHWFPESKGEEDEKKE